MNSKWALQSLAVILFNGQAVISMADNEPIVVGGSVAFSSEQNLLAESNGARVARISSNPALAHRLIDGSPRQGWQSEESVYPGRPEIIVFEIPGEPELGSVLVQTLNAYPSARLPMTVEVLASRADEPGQFVFLGRYDLAETAGWQWLRFPAQPASELMLRISAAHGEGPVGLGEVAAFGPDRDPRLRAAPGSGPAYAERDGLGITLLERFVGRRYEGLQAQPGELLVVLRLQLFNLLPEERLVFEPHSAMVLVEEGFYVHEPSPDSNTLSEAFSANLSLAPGESLRGALVFRTPDDVRFLSLAAFTDTGPLWLELTPALAPPREAAVLAATDPAAPIVVYVFGIERLGQTGGLRLDIGISGNDYDEHGQEFPVHEMIQLQDAQGRTYTRSSLSKPRDRSLPDVVLLRPGLLTRGEIEFADAPATGGLLLALPYEEYAAARLPPPDPLAPPREPYARPEVIPEGVAPPVVSGGRPPATDRPPIAPAEPAQPEPEPTQPTGPRPISGIPDVLSTGLLSIRGQLLPLYGVDGLYEPYMANFAAYLGDRDVSCKPVVEGAYRCMLGDADLSEVVLANGAGRATPDAPDNLIAAEAEARAAGKGIWR